MAEIVQVHHPDVERTLVEEAIARFYWLRELPELRKPPATSELVDWISALVRGGIPPERLTDRIPYLGALIKKERDLLATTRAMKSAKSRRR